jgi:uncharacterized membrane protein
MESFVGVVLVAGVGLIMWLASRTSKLETQVKTLGNELRVTNRRLTLMSAVDMPEAEAEAQPVPATAAMLPPRQARPNSRPIVPEMQAMAAPILEEVAPSVGVAFLMAEDLAAQRKSEGPSLVEEWLARARTSGEWEALIGGNWLNRIGAIALTLGIGFFLKYAFDNNWIKQGAQVGIGVTLGVALLAFARRTAVQGYAVFAQGLVGAGLAILYLSIYASYNFYDLVGLPEAFVALAVVIAVAFYQSLYYDSLVVAILAWGGGFLTPFLLSSSSGSAAGVTLYVVLLDVGILGIVLKKDAWGALEGLSLAATYAVYLTWFLTSYNSSQIVTAAIALTLFWLVFYALDVWRIRVGAPSFLTVRAKVASANTVAYYGFMFALVFPSHRSAMGFITLGVGAVYFSTILVIRRSLQGGDRVDARFTLTALTLLVVATALVTSGFTTVIFWSLEGVGLLWAGIRWNLRYVWQPSLVLYGLAAVWLPANAGALYYEPVRNFVPVLNLRFLAFLTLAAALATGTVLIRTLRDIYAERIWTSLHYGWCGVVFVLLTVETDDIFRRAMDGATGDTFTFIGYSRFLALAGVWTLLALPFVWFGLQRRILPILISGLSCAVLGIGLGAMMGAAFQPVQFSMYEPFLNVRAGLLVMVMAALFVHMRWLRARMDGYAWTETVRIVFQAALILLGFELLTAEVNDYFAHAAGNQTQDTHDVGLFVEFVSLGIMWMAYSLFLVWNGVRKTSQTLLVAGLGSAGVAIGAGAYCGFVAQPDARLPLVLGTRAVMMPLLMLGLFLHMRWMKDASRVYRWVDGVLAGFQAAIVLLGFELVTGETRDFFDHLVSTSSRPLADSSHLRNLEQLTLSALWLLYAIVLMGVGLWRRTRWMRFGSIGLFGFIILKIFVYDLSFLHDPYRSVSFAGLGMILLGVSYLYGRYHSLLLEV